jgi:hypothetical protein
MAMVSVGLGWGLCLELGLGKFSGKVLLDLGLYLVRLMTNSRSGAWIRVRFM